MTRRWLTAALPGLLCACAGNLHTMESTAHLSREELIALCDDLRMRANMDCEWNMRERQSTVADQQTWEINCRARRDSARESFDNVCQPWRLQQPVPESAERSQDRGNRP